MTSPLAVILLAAAALFGVLALVQALFRRAVLKRIGFFKGPPRRS